MPNSVKFNDRYPDISRSDLYYARALKVIPSATQTLAKGPGQFVKGIAPKYLQRGLGSHVWDVDGNEYVDYVMGVGPLSLGYCYERVDDAVRAQLESGITFSLMHPLEIEVAELINRLVPGDKSIRFSKTGADVTSAAVRLARAFTGRNKVLCCGYHGWHDWYVSVTGRSAGVPSAVADLTFTFTYNDLQSLEDSLDGDTACVILEPVVFEHPKDNFLQRLKELCELNGSLLIFDEMWTGFRLAPGGAQEYFGVEADLATYSKAVANGMPLSVLAGRRDVMALLESDVFFYTTFGGEALSLAAAEATIREIVEKNVPGQLARQGKKLKDGYNQTAEELGLGYTRCVGPDCRSLIAFDGSAGDPLELKSLVQQEMIKRGILWSGFHNMCYQHTDLDVTHTLSAYKEALSILHDAVERHEVRQSIIGEPVGPVFRKTGDFNSKPAIKGREARLTG